MAVLGFGEWLPDLPPLENTGAIYVNNVVPTAGGNYAPWYAFTPINAYATTERCQGAITARANNGTVSTIAGGRTKLSLATTGAFSDVSRLVGGAYTGQETDYWKFAKFGDVVFGTNFADKPQQFTLSSSTNFTDSATFPRAKFITASKDFVFLGNINDSFDGLRPERVAWSQIRAATYTPGVGLSDNNDLLGDGGVVMGLHHGSYLTVLQEKAVWRADFTGDVAIPFAFQKFESTQGSSYPNGSAQYADVVYFISQDGFCRSNGQTVETIGSGKVNKYFNDNINRSYPERVYAAIDVLNRLVVWVYPSLLSSGTPDKAIIYYMNENRFSQGDVAVDAIFSTLTRDTSIDDIPLPLDALGAVSLDSAVYAGGAYRLGGFNSSNLLCYRGSSPLAATIIGAEVQITPNRRTTLKGLKVSCDVMPQSSMTVSVGTRDNQGATSVFTTMVTPSARNHFPFRADGRYHRARVDVAANATWTKLQGLIDLEYRPSGLR